MAAAAAASRQRRWTMLFFLMMLGFVHSVAALRGLGLPNRELFMDASGANSTTRSPNNGTAAAVASSRSRDTAAGTSSSSTNTTAGLTLSGLKEQLGGIKDHLQQEGERHSRAAIAAAATIGSLLLLSAVGCAGMLVYRRFVSSQHSSSKKGRAANKYFDEDRLLADAGL